MKNPIFIFILFIAFSPIAEELIPEPTYPQIMITPSKPVEGDTVDFWLIKDMYSNSCVPTYTNGSYEIEKQPEDIYPPDFTIYLSYTEIWPSESLECLAVMTEYGPKFTFKDMEVGNYTVMDNNSIAGSFRVFENDGVVYRIVTEKDVYTIKEYLQVKYTMKNESTDKVTYYFATTCQFDMVIRDNMGYIVYSYLDSTGCGDAPTQISLDPGESTEFVFPSYRITREGYNSLTIYAQMIGYDRSAVSSQVYIINESGINSSNSLTCKNKHVVYFPNKQQLSMHLDRSQNVSVEVYLPNGKNVKHLSIKGFFQAGNHTFDLCNLHFKNRILFIRINAEDFSETKKINLVR